ncbi:MAG TPA: YihY/virulence factor BrkB family protein [Fimbriimonadaceae bacterium]|nr:YihY/virulence factor BrkB family protein [Fimbriimonadaceae bacterium]
MTRLGKLWDLLKKAAKRWGEDNSSRKAAALAFYAILSLAPLLLFATVIGGQFLNSNDLRLALVREARTQLGAGAADLVRGMIESARRPAAGAVATLISICLALFGASNLFDQLNLSVSAIWHVTPKRGHALRNYVASKLFSVLLTLGLVIVMIGWLALDSVLGFLGRETGQGFLETKLLSFIASMVVLTALFAVTLRSLPRGKVKWKDVWLAAALTALGISISKYLLGVYFSVSSVGSAYGPAGALVIVLLWFYYSAQIYFFGVEMTFVYAYEYGSHKAEEPGELERS